jgi:multiple sugar transport system substrate-binding protein
MLQPNGEPITPRSRRRATRRAFLGVGARLLGTTGVLALLAACGQAATTGASTSAAGSTAAPAPSTAAVASSSAAPTTTALSSAATSAVTTTATSGAAVTTSATSAAATTASASSAAATAAATAPTTTASASSAAAAAPGGATITLDFWNPASDTNGKAIIADLVSQWNKQNPSLPVKDTVVGNDNNYVKYTSALAGGAPPDAIMTYDYDPMPGWAYGGALLPLDAYAAQMKINQSDYFPIVWPMMSFQGHIWGFLQEFDSELYGWNQDLFAKNGLSSTPPKTIAELDDLNTKLTVHDSSGAITQLGIAPGYGGVRGGSDGTWVAVFGGMYYDTLKQEFTITRAENAAALDWMAGWWKKLGGRSTLDAYNKAVNGQGGLANGKQAMGIVTSHLPNDWKTQYPSLNMETALTPTQPGVFYGTASAGGGNLFCVAKGVKHQQESASFIKYMGDPAAVTAWDARENNMPPLKSVALSADFAKQVPGMHAFLQMLQLSATDNHITGPIVHPVIDEFNDLKGKTVNDILDGKVTAAQGLQQLDSLTKAAMSKYTSKT